MAKSVSKDAPTLFKDHKTAPWVEKGTKQGEKRKGYIVNIERADKIDAIAYWERIDIKDVVDQAFTDYISKYEKKNGVVKSIKK